MSHATYPAGVPELAIEMLEAALDRSEGDDKHAALASIAASLVLIRAELADGNDVHRRLVALEEERLALLAGQDAVVRGLRDTVDTLAKPVVTDDRAHLPPGGLRELEDLALTQLIVQLEDEGQLVLSDGLPAGVLAGRILGALDRVAVEPEDTAVPS